MCPNISQTVGMVYVFTEEEVATLRHCVLCGDISLLETDMWKSWSFAMLRNETRKDRNIEKRQRKFIFKKCIEKCKLPFILDIQYSTTLLRYTV